LDETVDVPADLQARRGFRRRPVRGQHDRGPGHPGDRPDRHLGGVARAGEGARLRGIGGLDDEADRAALHLERAYEVARQERAAVGQRDAGKAVKYGVARHAHHGASSGRYAQRLDALPERATT
jgi:hypothetical protein